MAGESSGTHLGDGLALSSHHFVIVTFRSHTEIYRCTSFKIGHSAPEAEP